MRELVEVWCMVNILPRPTPVKEVFTAVTTTSMKLVLCKPRASLCALPELAAPKKRLALYHGLGHLLLGRPSSLIFETHAHAPQTRKRTKANTYPKVANADAAGRCPPTYARCARVKNAKGAELRYPSAAECAKSHRSIKQ